MNNLSPRYMLFWVLVLVCLLFHTFNVNAATSKISAISVVLDDNYPPYSFRDSQGNLQGITIDQWKLFEHKTGIKVNITRMTWNKAIERMTRGEFDVIDTISYSADRTKLFDYAEPYATLEVPIFFRKNISGITDVNSLKGFTVAAKKGDKELLSTVNSGFVKISRSEYQVIEKRWFGSTSIPFHEHPLFRVIVIIGSVVILAALMLFIWNRTLQRMVKEKTCELSKALSAKEQVAAEIRVLNAVLEQQNDLWRESQRVARMGSYVTNLETREWMCSPELHDIFGIDATYPHTLEGWRGIVHPDWQGELALYLLQVESSQQPFDYEYKIIRVHDGAERWVHELGKIELYRQVNEVRLIGMIQDVTDRKRAEEEIVYLSFHDQLTGFYNRRFFEEELLRLDVPRNYPLTLVMGDVNGLKLINDSFGHVTVTGQRCRTRT